MDLIDLDDLSVLYMDMQRAVFYLLNGTADIRDDLTAHFCFVCTPVLRLFCFHGHTPSDIPEFF